MASARTVLPIIAATWIGSAYVMAYHGAPLLPRALAARLTLETFLIGVLLVSSALGLALSRLLLAEPRAALALTPPKPSHAAVAALVAPIVTVVSLYLGFELALETILAELRAGGVRAVEANTGELGRAIASAHVVTILAWAVVVTPIAEELMFRGALWSALAELAAGIGGRDDRELPPELAGIVGPRSARRGWLAGGAATLGSAAVFTWLHADQAGGAGIVRAAQAACLGVALGVSRHLTRSVWPGVLLHAAFNLLAIAKTRRWVESPGWPPPLPIPVLYWQLAAAAALAVLLWLVHARARHVTARAALFVGRPPPAVFDFVVEPASIPASFRGHGPIPGAKHAELVGSGGMRVGARRRVENTDGTTVEEVIVALERPWHHAYELVAGLVPPFSLLVSGGRGDWRLEPEGDGTRITWTFRWHLTSGLLWPVAWLFARSFARAMQGCLVRHRDHLERLPPSNRDPHTAGNPERS